MNQQIGGRQHVIPASHIASFSDDEYNNERKRKRIVWHRRDGDNAKDLKAETIGIRKNIYTLHGDNIDVRYVDKTWKYVEDNLSKAVLALNEHNKIPYFDGTIWVTVLVPFVAQLFVRGEDYEKLLLGRAPTLGLLDGMLGPNSINDNTNFNRLIDFQINCGLLCNSEWRLLHNKTDTPFVLSDLGFATFNAQRYGYGTGEGYLIPMSKSLMLVVTRKNSIQSPIDIKSSQIMLIHKQLEEKNKVEFFNRRIVKCAFSEAYGPTQEAINEAWGNRAFRRRERLVGPKLIQSPLRDKDKLHVHWEWMDKFNVPQKIRKEVYGGRKIEVVEETRGMRMYLLRYKDL